MPGKKKGKRFSVDEYLAEYRKKEAKRKASIESVLEKKREELKRTMEREDEARREGKEPEEWSPPERKGSDYEELKDVKEVVKNRWVIFFTYALRAFTITLMAYLMLFIILHDVLKGRPVISYFSNVADSFIEFVLSYLSLFIGVFLTLFGLQAAYYIFFWIAKKRWKVYSREETVYAIAFALVGLIASIVIVYALGFY